jgi:uncharacterized LabA/DUF88 family protein
MSLLVLLYLYIPPIPSGLGREAMARAVAFAFYRLMQKTIVYVDGFNLYYGALKGTPYKWLNLYRLAQLLLPKNQIIGVKYFTAQVSARPHDPDQPTRQQTYLRALRTVPNLEIILGHFLAHEIDMPLAGNPKKMVKVIKTEEKGSDVNIAAHLINDGYQKRYEVAVLITNDSDLLEPIKIVRQELKLPVGIINPQKKASWVLAQHAAFMKSIRKWTLQQSQFPTTLHDTRGTFHKPSSW